MDRDLTQQEGVCKYYAEYWRLTNRQWRRKGLRFTDVSKGLVDPRHVVEVFEACANDPMPSRLAALYLIWAQVCVFRGMAAKAAYSLTPYTYGIHAEILYDRLVDRMLTKHHDTCKDGVPKASFTKAPVPWLLNVVRRTIQDSVYDMYRHEHDLRAGRKAAPRAPARKVLLDSHIYKMATEDVRDIFDNRGYDEDSSPWAEMERLNTGKPLWEN